MNGNEIFYETGCLLDCYKSEYKATKALAMANPLGMTLVYKFPTGRYTDNTEYVLYDYNTFIADIGGYLGLLLGQSVFGVYQLAAGMKTPKIFSV